MLIQWYPHKFLESFIINFECNKSTQKGFLSNTYSYKYLIPPAVFGMNALYLNLKGAVLLRWGPLY